MRKLTLKEKIIYFFKDLSYYQKQNIEIGVIGSGNNFFNIDFPPSYHARYSAEELEDIRAEKIYEILEELEQE